MSYGRHRPNPSHAALPPPILASSIMSSPHAQPPAPVPPLLYPKPAPRTSSTTPRTCPSHSRIHVLHLHADRALSRQKPLPRPRRCDPAAATRRSRFRLRAQPSPLPRPKPAETSTRAREVTTSATPQLAPKSNGARASRPSTLTPPTTAIKAATFLHRARRMRRRRDRAPQHLRTRSSLAGGISNSQPHSMLHAAATPAVPSVLHASLSHTRDLQHPCTAPMHHEKEALAAPCNTQ